MMIGWFQRQTRRFREMAGLENGGQEGEDKTYHASGLTTDATNRYPWRGRVWIIRWLV